MGYTLVIDNYDSFTWNIYADIATLGGNPLVRRNDKITIQDIEAMHAAGDLDRIVISPGPGHPATDSGISREVITWGLGRLPILGVCMGLECLVDVLGGEIAYAGEIKHGKTSCVKHDHLGIFHDLPDRLSSTRYHSLSAQVASLPKALAVTATTEESGVIMGVRHREFCVEAVQYHPESCMSEGGRGMMANFLKMKGGKWGGENAWCGVKPAPLTNGDAKPNGVANGAPSLPTILNKIHAQRLLDVEAAQSSPSTTPANLKTALALHAAPSLISFVDRLTTGTTHTPAIMAEIKRASPSKGDIAPNTSAPAQALRYALAGASVISVLTEPKWFKGALSDMLTVRQALDSVPNRPAILRKDFILAPYQIDEARLHGADTVLLIVAMLSPELLRELYSYSLSLGMEPLVEVNSPAELVLALELGAKVIGVNNRNLHDFNVDMSTTSRVNAALASAAYKPILCALSGISSPADVEKYVAEGVRAVLVGESLMRAADPSAFLRELIGLPAGGKDKGKGKPLVKICGVRSAEDAKLAIDAGADMIGIILVPGAKRCIDLPTAQSISDLVRSARRSSPPAASTSSSSSTGTLSWFAHHAAQLRQRRKPLLVGVVQNQPLSDVLRLIDDIGLDVIQLHGDEPQSWARVLPVPVIKCFKVDGAGKIRGGEVDRPGANAYVLLDAGGSGGEGKKFDWTVAKRVVGEGEVGSEGKFKLPIILAGGLNPGNVAEAVEALEGEVLCVDVSSGVEGEGGKKSPEAVRAFVQAVKGGV